MSEGAMGYQHPYVGLRPFWLEDSPFFFGRDQQTAEVLDTLREHRFLAVVGSSGCGKSSLVRAGVVPMLLGGFLVGDRDRWAIARLKPGSEPLTNLAEALVEMISDQDGASPTAVPSCEEVRERIRENHTRGVLGLLEGALDADTNLLLVVDQFEEIFAFRTDDSGTEGESQRERLKRVSDRKAEAADFVDLLLKLSAHRKRPIYVALTMRTDFLGDCDVFAGLPEAMNRGRYLVPRLTRPQLSAAIRGPALLLGTEIAPRLHDLLLNLLGDRPDRLPVLQHLLLRMWDLWSRRRIGPIDLAHYEEAGGLDGALAKDARKALSALDEDITARVFKALTDTDISQRRVRRPARISELVSASGATREAVETVISSFRADRRNFVYPSDDGIPEDPRIDIAHESLIRQWSDLRRWVDEERKARDRFLELVQRARQGKALLTEPDLSVADEWWYRTEKPTAEWARRYSEESNDHAVAQAYLERSLEEAAWAEDTERQRLEDERRLLAKEEQRAKEEAARLREENARRKRTARRWSAAAIVMAAVSGFAGWAWYQAKTFESALSEEQDLAGASRATILGLVELNGLWDDTTVSATRIRETFDSLDSLEVELPPTSNGLWQTRLGYLARWDTVRTAAEALHEDPEAGINEKQAAWRALIEEFPPRRGRDVFADLAEANRRSDELARILQTTIEVREATFAVCPARPGCPRIPTCEGVAVAVGDRACVYFDIDTHDQNRREQATLRWRSGSGETLHQADPRTGIRGRTYSIFLTMPNSERVPAARSEFQVLNRNGTVVFRRMIHPEA